MNSGLISYRYAKALLQFADAQNATDAVYSEAKLVEASFKHATKIRSVLANPVISKSEKQKLLLLTAGDSPSKTLENFVDLIIKNGREGNFERIMRKYVELYREKHQIHSAKLTTALKLDSAVEKKILDRIKQTIGGSIEVEKNVDPDILGGFVFEVDYTRLDASLSRQLAAIKKEYVLNNSKAL